MATPNAAPLSRAEIEARRRQLRKGTHSCWECKRRKMRCVFDPSSHTPVCHGCRMRGSRCLTQEFPEDSLDDLNRLATSHPPADSPGDLPPGARTVGGFSGDKPFTPASTVSEPLRDHISGERASLSQYLHRALPSREDIQKIYTLLPQRPVLAHEIMTMPYTCLSPDYGPVDEHSLEIPEPQVHPVLIAKYMLLLASLLQHMPRACAEASDLSETPRTLSERLAGRSISCVTTKDDMLGSIECLECILIESVYHANLGSLRRSWVASRRALSIAQLMGLGRSDNRLQYEVLDHRTRHDPRGLWHRIVFMDRFLCLMLGLPQGCTQRNMTPEVILASDVSMERLERLHCAVASRILERNEDEPSPQDLAFSRMLDLELQKAARSVPSKWWLIPKRDAASTDPRALVYNTGRIFAQVLHYNLLNQLHLPYMLRSSVAGRKYEYSTITCVSASREILARCIALREFNATGCRILDFMALMAAMTVLLAHLDSRASGADNVLAHQFHSDRAMIEQIQENFRDADSESPDSLASNSASLLSKLLTIEADDSLDAGAISGSVSVHRVGVDETGLTSEGAVCVHIPYFGIIRIARQDPRPEMPANHYWPRQTVSNPAYAQVSNLNGERHSSNQRANRETQASTSINSQDLARTSTSVSGSSLADPQARTLTSHPDVWMTPISASDKDPMPQQLGNLNDPLMPYGEAPGLASGIEEWAFQGVDLAFFDNFMRNTANGSTRPAD